MQETSEYAKILVEHRVKKEMDKLREKQYKLQDNYCETVWNFSKKHDFGNFFVNYPRQRIPPPCNCEFLKETTEKIEKEIQENEELQKLNNEIKSLELELKNFEEEEEEIENTKKRNLKFSSDDDNEIERLTEILEKSQEDLKFLENEIVKHRQNEQVATKDVETNSFVKIMSKTIERGYEKPKKLKLAKEISHRKHIPLLNCPNTIDNYMIVKGKNNPSTQEINYQTKNEEAVENYQLLKNPNQQESVILSSWTRNTVPNDFSFVEAESSTSGTFSKKMEIKSMISEGKSKSFTPKRKSSIAEKFSQKLNEKLNKSTEL
ncbi:uncharacterized protein LOC122511454 isoform X2 [Leptopilina heterotoma]|uniref:uncharacterized protein LOC122511454 isoform X2 n=1 Tax=Leptopilina heterotoma TaxID=63436 RepID=UPI001CA9C089|nr:uncharacterized protein LOC122511454 isoform X2 [Leptopilina heterotoma]